METKKFKKIKIKRYKFQKNRKKELQFKKIFCFTLLFISFFSCILIIIKLLKKTYKKINRRNVIKKLDFTNFITYSQCLEDFILYCIFYDIDNGFYIDVGANDPNYISVTKAFYLNGWHGINIEPLPEMFSLISKNRIRDINLNIGAGEKEGIMSLNVRGACSTLNKKYFNDKEPFINVTIYPLSKICKKYVPKDEEIQFCKIDVEGYEKYALLGYDFKNYRPKVFCIESASPANLAPSYQEWEYILLQNGYAFGFEYNVNRYYYDTKVDYIGKRFTNLDKYIKKYKKIQIRKK